MSVNASEVSNRRRDPRRLPRTYVQVTCVKGATGLGANLAVRLLDVSETGIRMLVKAGLPIGQEIEVSIVGPARGRPCKQLAEVVWSVPAADGAFCIGAGFRKRMNYAKLLDICR